MTSAATTRFPAPLPQGRTWRVATATRAFALALGCGQLISTRDIDATAVTVVALALVAVAASAIELDTFGQGSRWASIVEGVIAAILLGTSQAPVEALMVYLAVPPVVAGLRSGTVATLNTSFASIGAMIGAWYGADQVGRDLSQFSAAVPWITVGLGAGLLAARQSREARTLKAEQAPYAAAHRLVSQLHSLSRKLPMGLDSPTVASTILTTLTDRADCQRGCIVVRLPLDTADTIAVRGSMAVDDERVALSCLKSGKVERGPGVVALPLRIGEDTFGALALARPDGVPDHTLEELQSELDAQALRLDTALLFDDVRSMATSEERNRLAREIHDGVAQEIASLGYAIDDLAASSNDPEISRAAEELRLEVSRVVGELRLSILDLRHGVDEAGGLSGALAEYVREVSGRTNLRAHLTLDENGEQLSRRTEAELLRIAQEAVGNVRKHAHAENLWLTLATEGRNLRLTVADDGVGTAAPKSGHYGMHTMRERAEAIGAELLVEDRPGGGTIITVQSRAVAKEGTRDDHHRAVG
jgi:signal transduction histidine kinase